MGIFSSEKKTTNLTQLDASTKEAIADVSGAGATGISVEGGFGTRVNVTDQGSIAKAFQFGSESLAASGDAITKALGFGESSLAYADAQNRRALDVMTQALQAQKSTQTDALTFMQRAGEQAMSQVSALARPDVAMGDKMLYGLVALGIGMMIFAWVVSK